jgi:hypothetical protein
MYKTRTISGGVYRPRPRPPSSNGGGRRAVFNYHASGAAFNEYRTYAVRWSSRPWSEAEELALSPDAIGTEGVASRPRPKLGAPPGLDTAFGLLDQQIFPQLRNSYE